MPPPKPPLPAALITANISAEAELKKAEEAEKRKPDWLEELSRKQAHRKSGLFSDSKSESSAVPTRYVMKPFNSNDPNTRHKKSGIFEWSTLLQVDSKGYCLYANPSILEVSEWLCFTNGVKLGNRQKIRVSVFYCQKIIRQSGRCYFIGSYLCATQMLHTYYFINRHVT